MEVMFTYVKPPVRQRLKKAGRGEKYLEIIAHQTIREALREAGLLKDLPP